MKTRAAEREKNPFSIEMVYFEFIDVNKFSALLCMREQFLALFTSIDIGRAIRSLNLCFVDYFFLSILFCVPVLRRRHIMRIPFCFSVYGVELSEAFRTSIVCQIDGHRHTQPQFALVSMFALIYRRGQMMNGFSLRIEPFRQSDHQISFAQCLNSCLARG